MIYEHGMKGITTRQMVIKSQMDKGQDGWMRCRWDPEDIKDRQTDMAGLVNKPAR